MANLVSLEQVNQALRLDMDLDADLSGNPDADRIADVTAKIAQASDIVLNYLKNPADSEYWDEDSTPERIQAATVLVVGSLYDGEAEPLSDPVKDILRRDRDPALA